MQAIRALSVAALLLGLSPVAIAQTSGGGASGGTSGTSSVSGPAASGLGSNNAGAGPIGIGTTGPGRTSSSGTADPCPGGATRDATASDTNQTGCRPVASTGRFEPGEIYSPPSIMAPPPATARTR